MADEKKEITPWDLQEGESMIWLTKKRGPQGIELPFMVTRVPNGWIMRDANQAPVFVPLTTPTNPNV